MESHSCDVSKYVGLLVQIEKYLQVVHADESRETQVCERRAESGERKI
jgi:hypothetical protein